MADMAESTKVCSRCGDTKPLTDFANNSRSRDGLEYHCRTCHAAAYAAWRLKNLDKRRDYQREWYDRNPGAKAQHNRTYSAAHSAEIVAKVARWRAANLPRARATRRAWYAANRDKIAEYRATAERRAQKVASDRAWRLANLERVAANSRRWRQENPDRYRAATSRRKALMRDAPGFATIEQIQARVTYFGGKCWMCGADWESIDHVKPLSKGGSNWPSNLRPACISCNSSKRDTWPFALVLAA